MNDAPQGWCSDGLKPGWEEECSVHAPEGRDHYYDQTPVCNALLNPLSLLMRWQGGETRRTVIDSDHVSALWWNGGLITLQSSCFLFVDWDLYTLRQHKIEGFLASNSAHFITPGGISTARFRIQHNLKRMLSPKYLDA